MTSVKCRSLRLVLKVTCCILTLFVLTILFVASSDWTVVPHDTQRDIGLQFNGLSINAELRKIRTLEDGNAEVVLQINGPGARDLAEMVKETAGDATFERLTDQLDRNQYSENLKSAYEFSNHSEHINKSYKFAPKKTDYPVTIETPFLINNPEICAQVKMLDVLVIVHTAMDHTGRRRLIRETWANTKLFKNVTIRVVFFVGETDSKDLNTIVENESIVYKDIVQGMFHDSYRNLTNKGVLTYKWISEFCPNTRMILKVDDDMFVDIFKVVDVYLPKFSKHNKTIGCHLRRKGTSPILRSSSKSKWRVDENQFRSMSHFPFDYCNGYFVLMTTDLVKPMYTASRISPFFWIDDVYLYGILPSKVGKVTYISMTKSLSVLSKPGIQCFTKKKDCALVASGAAPSGAVENMWFSKLSNLNNATWSRITI